MNGSSGASASGSGCPEARRRCAAELREYAAGKLTGSGADLLHAAVIGHAADPIDTGSAAAGARSA